MPRVERVNYDMIFADVSLTEVRIVPRNNYSTASGRVEARALTSNQFVPVCDQPNWLRYYYNGPTICLALGYAGGQAYK